MDGEGRTRRDALIQAGLALASELSLPSVLQKIIDLACEVADARYGALGVLGPAGDRIEDFITHGITEEEYRAIGSLPRGRGILGVLIEEARPLRLRRIQDHDRAVGFPPNHPPMTSFLGVPVKVRDRVFGNLYLTEKRGGEEFTTLDEQAVKTLAAQAAVAIENARLYEDARARQRRLEATTEVTQAILDARPTEEVLRLIAGHARELARGALATVVTPEADGETLAVRVAVGKRSESLEGMRFPADDSISGDVMRTLGPALIPDLAADERAHQPVVRAGDLGPALVLPLAVGERRFGTLLVANETGALPFSEEDLEVVRLFATQAASALEYGRIRGELQRLAVLEERERIARELHDGVIQSLFALGMSLQATEAVADDQVRERLSGAVDTVDAVIRDLRNYIFALRPGGVADVHLDRALRELAEGFSEAAEVDVEIDPEAAARLSWRASDLLQAAREALSNAVRHSGGMRVALALRLSDREAVLEVRDDGKGFDPAEAEGKGQGLTNLRSRAKGIGGELSIDSGDGGTTVRLRVPL